MICPHCLKTIDDGLSFCPHCRGYVGSGSSAEFLFCEGCGARLAPGERSCPKCGRPAPGILSTDSAAADLAAGKTASFPRLTQQAIETEVPEFLRGSRTAPEGNTGASDPSATNVLAGEKLTQSADADPYHEPPHRSKKPFIIALLILALVGGGAYFVTADPLGVMPGFRQSLEDAAGDMFPSRNANAGSAVDTAAAAEKVAAKAKEEAAESGALTDKQAYQRLSALYKRITEQHDALGNIIDDYNAGYIASDIDMRNDCAASAYGARDVIDSVTKELNELQFEEGSAYAGDVQNLLQLAGWVRQRIDMYCASWDISLSFTGESDLPMNHQDEILAPLREGATEDEAARTEYFAHVDAWKPVEH